MAVIYQEFKVISVDGTVLQGRSWKPEGKPKATLCLVHGFGEHSGRYDSWARKFCEHDIMVYSIDYRGHGKSEGKRGVVNSIAEINDDINAMLRRCKGSWRDIPNYIYGHSMGGLLVLNFLMKRRSDFEGAIVTSPCLGLTKPLSPFKTKAIKYLDYIIPKRTFSAGISSEQMTQSSDLVEERESDELMHGRISVRLFNQVHERTVELNTVPQNVRIPIFMAHGLADPVTDPEATIRFAEKYTPLTTFVGYENALHELHNEPVADELFDEIIKFMAHCEEQSKAKKIL